MEDKLNFEVTRNFVDGAVVYAVTLPGEISSFPLAERFYEFVSKDMAAHYIENGGVQELLDRIDKDTLERTVNEALGKLMSDNLNSKELGKHE